MSSIIRKSNAVKHPEAVKAMEPRTRYTVYCEIKELETEIEALRELQWDRGYAILRETTISKLKQQLSILEHSVKYWR